MRSYRECVPCMYQQALCSARMAAEDECTRTRIMHEVECALRGIDMQQSPPAMGQGIHRIVRQVSGCRDPYREVKDRLNHAALDLYPRLKEQVAGSAKPLAAAARLAIAGNMMDCGVNSEVDAEHVQPFVEQAFTEPLAGDAEEFARAVHAAETVLYLADNAGEIVLDRLLIDMLPREKVTVAVRGAPVINDATLEDAETANLLGFVEVIENGSDAPGTILDDCGNAFQESFASADLVIAKGQGNYETLSEVEKDIFFLLKIKCPVIARDIRHNLGAMVLQRAQTKGVFEKGGGDIAGI